VTAPVKRRGTKKSAKAISRSLRMRVSATEVTHAAIYANPPRPPKVKLSLRRPWDLPKRRQRRHLQQVLDLPPGLLAAGFVPLD